MGLTADLGDNGMGLILINKLFLYMWWPFFFFFFFYNLFLLWPMNTSALYLKSTLQQKEWKQSFPFIIYIRERRQLKMCNVWQSITPLINIEIISTDKYSLGIFWSFWSIPITKAEQVNRYTPLSAIKRLFAPFSPKIVIKDPFCICKNNKNVKFQKSFNRCFIHKEYNNKGKYKVFFLFLFCKHEMAFLKWS